VAFVVLAQFVMQLHFK